MSLTGTSKTVCNPLKEVRVKLRVAGQEAARKAREAEAARWKELAARAVPRPFGPCTRVHNWLEDLALEQERVSSFLERRCAGALRVQRSRALLARLLAPAQLSAPGEELRFGSRVQMVASEVAGWPPGAGGACCPPVGVTLAGGAFEDTLDAALSCGGLVPGCPLVCVVEGGPVARSAFEVRDECGGAGRHGQPLLFGQHFTLALLACAAADGALFVSSRAPVHGAALRTRGGQEVSLCGCACGATRWLAVCADRPALRPELDGQPVGPAGCCALILYHHATGRPLGVGVGSGGGWRATHFGAACDAVAGLCPDAANPATGAPPRAEGARNRWRMVGAAAAAAAAADCQPC